MGIVSDYRYRGVSLSDGDPAGQLSVAYDAAQGSYAGAFLSTVKLEPHDMRGAHAIAFAGHTWRTSSALTFEAGADYAAFTSNRQYDYFEAYVGFAAREISGRLYFSPRYFGQHASATYAELNFAHPVFENVRLLVHAGALHNASSGYPVPRSRSLFDGAFGIGIDRYGFNLNLSWVGTSHSSDTYPSDPVERRNGLVASLSRAF